LVARLCPPSKPPGPHESSTINGRRGRSRARRPLKQRREQLSTLTGGTLAATIEAAMIVALADGSLAESEVVELADSINDLTGGIFDVNDLCGLMQGAASRIVEYGPEAVIPAIDEALDGVLRESALAMAAATAYKRRGIDAKEGVALQQLRDHVGISEHRYFELLSLGRTLAQS
jgi:hypothetical protein